MPAKNFDDPIAAAWRASSVACDIVGTSQKTRATLHRITALLSSPPLES